MRLLKLNLKFLTFAAFVSLAFAAAAPSTTLAKSGQAQKVEASPIQALNKARAQQFLTCAPKRFLQVIFALAESTPGLSLAGSEMSAWSFYGETYETVAANQLIYCGPGDWKSLESLSALPATACTALQESGPAAEKFFAGAAVPSAIRAAFSIAGNLVHLAFHLTTQSPNGSWYSPSAETSGTISNYYFSTYQIQQLLTQNPQSQCMKAKAKVKELEAAIATPALK